MGPRRTRYTDALLTVIAVLLGILAIDGMGGVTSSAVASGPPGQSAKKIPGTGLVSAADQRKMIIAELKSMSGRIEKLEGLLNKGIAVKVTEMPEIRMPKD